MLRDHRPDTLANKMPTPLIRMLIVLVNIRLKSNNNKNYEHKRLHGKSRESQIRVARLDQENGEKTPHNCRSRSLSEIIVPRLFEEKQRDIVFGFPSFRPSFRPP